MDSVLLRKKSIMGSKRIF